MLFIFFISCLLALAQSQVIAARQAQRLAQTKSTVTPQKALEQLKAGNKRYLTKPTICINSLDKERTRLSTKQEPHSVIVCCSDSRVPPELIFDQRLGDIFVVRTAGLALQKTALGSIEYAATQLHTPLIVVLGHESCGAIKATLTAIKQRKRFDNNIQAIINTIKPSLKCTNRYIGKDQLDKAVHANIHFTACKIKQKSPTLAKLIKAKKVAIICAYYDLEDGHVEFFDSPQELFSSKA